MKVWTTLLALTLACLWTVTTLAQEKKDAPKKPRQSSEERFKEMDKDNSGTVTEAEFVAAYSRMGEEKAKALFQKMGGTADKGLTLEQYKKAREEFRKKYGERKPREKK